MATPSRDGKAKVAASADPAGHLDATVCGASVQLPAFDKIEPESWFCVADANFALRKVTDSTTRYYYVLSKLDATTLRKLSAFLKRPRGDDPYQEIRRQLCRTFEPSMEQKLDTLLAINDMGDERPMEFGLELQRLLGDASTGDILKRIFLRSAPPSITTAIKGSRNAKFEELLEAADDAWNTAAASSASASTSAVSVAAVSSAQPFRRWGRGGRQRGSRLAGQARTIQLCHFHIKFGDAAKKCNPSCARWGDQNRARDPPTQVFQVEEALDGEDADIGSEN